MAIFEYSAYDQSGGKVSGQIEAIDKKHALEQLTKKHLYTSDIKRLDANKGSPFSFGNRVSIADLEFLTSELSLLLESGVKIDRGIDIIKRTKAKPALAMLLDSLSRDLKKGKSLAEAFGAHPNTFDALYCNLIQLGEASGNLSDVFGSLATDLKFKRELQQKIISSLAYPSVIFFVCILSVFFIFNFIIPKMAPMFANAQDLPWYTIAMLSLSDWMVKYQGFLILGCVATVCLLIYAAKQENFKRWWQLKSLKLPIVGKAVLTIERIRFNSGLAMMVKSGVQIDQAIQLSAGNIRNRELRREMDVAKKKVKSGSQLTPALQQSSLYPDFYISLLEVGEESGNLSKVFDEIANRSRQEFESWTQRITTLLEPLMILFMGGFVGGVVVMMLMSMVSMNEIGF
ncbi:type II secretion system F family protein [Thalassotalea marina]|uniref:Type II secretion system protein GspF n=1 Tax=Thalassotalea marina TaxID=1673741 RepID=A0A919EHJ1_9GAMM|nr:type II secretion system F family protein [Thalassotalea marina]GHF80828.1 type II secretion system protein GspF [Thalassotalea marina]